MSQEAVTDANQIRDYGDGFLMLRTGEGEQLKVQQMAMITAENIIISPPLDPVNLISDTQLDYLKTLNSDVLLLVSASGLTRELSKQLLHLNQLGIATEVMQLGPACRTFNLLISEGRKPALLVSF